MINFIKKNKIISVGIASFVVIILIILALMLFSGINTTKKTSTKNPFGNTDTNRTSTQNNEDAFLFGTSSERFIAEETTKKDVPVFRALTKTPTAGMSVFERFEDGLLSQYVRYISTENGHIFEIPINYIGKDINISNKTILRIINTEWSKNSNSSLIQYYNEDSSNVFNYIGYFAPGTSTTQIEYTGHTLIGDITASAISPTGDKIFYLVKTKNGVQGLVENIKTGDKTKIWSSILTSLDVSWNTPNKIIVYTKPSSIAKSAVWSINPKTGEDDILLTKDYAISPKMNKLGTKLLYSMQETKKGVFSLRILDIKTKEIIHMPLATIAEKCTWDSDGLRYIYCAIPRNKISGKFLEDWYMGIKNSDDILWKIDTETGNVKRLLDPYKETEEKFDIENLMVTPDNNYLIFNTRVNKILWSLKLPEKLKITEDKTKENK